MIYGLTYIVLVDFNQGGGYFSINTSTNKMRNKKRGRMGLEMMHSEFKNTLTH